jgi:Tfp pilus assembly protein PilF
MKRNPSGPAAQAPHPASPALAVKLQQAIALHQQGQLAAAEPLYREILRAHPKHFDALHLLGVIAIQMGQPQAGADLIGQAIAVNRHHADAHANLGNALKDLGRPEEAIASYARALRLKPGSAVILNNMGAALELAGRPEESLAYYAKALSLKPDYVEALNNRGNALQALGRLEEAMACYAQVLQAVPGFAHAHWNESLCRLLAGDFAEGFEKFQSRLETPAFATVKRRYPSPPWLGGESVRGKTLLLHAEQGMGDTIQFCRYAKLAAAAGAKVLLEVQAPLKSLLAAVEDASQVIAQGEPVPPFDCHCPLLSLPLAFGTRLDTIPADIPYLRADPARAEDWQARLGPKTGPRIGLVWSGSAGHEKDRRRSLPLAEFAKLAAGQAQFISLQKEVRAADQPVLAQRGDIARHGETLGDFADTAALVANLDLVVSVDTSVAHLAGAMGKPVWLLLPFTPDWRWLLGREDSPWYPSARLFRQSRAGDWEGVIQRVAQALAGFRPEEA